ncbi:MAG: hypothetical protein HYV09_22705 [Deltaproteobacteria bacterium]|nr:hypothetical protein [Deltaproteobacteria bacterium]
MTFRLLRFATVAAVLAAAGLGAGCKPKPGTYVATPTAPAGAVDLDGDPAALLPYGSVLIANLGAKEIANSTVGGDLVALSERILPFAKEIDFEIKRDLDRVYIGMYSFSGADLLGVMSGRFDPAKMEAAANKGLNTPFGVVVASTYAGRKIYTVANVGFTVLSTKTALVGSEAAMRRALDRIQVGTIRREMAPWMADWVSQPGYPVLLASDVTKQSFGKTVTGFIPWIQGVQYVRVRGRFNPDTSYGMSGALTYPDPQKAQQAASGFDSIKKSFTMMAALKMIGIDPLVRNAVVQAQGNDMQFSTVIDEKQTRMLIRLLADWVGSGTPPALPSPQPSPGSSAPPGTKI